MLALTFEPTQSTTSVILRGILALVAPMRLVAALLVIAQLARIRSDVDHSAFYGGETEWTKFLATDCDPRHHSRLAAQGVCNGK